MFISCILPLLRIPNLLITLLEIKSLQSLHSGNQHWSDCFFSCLLILGCVKCPHFPPSPFLCLLPCDVADSLLDVPSCGVALRAPCRALGTRGVMFAVPVWLCTARTFPILCCLIAARFCWCGAKLWPV